MLEDFQKHINDTFSYIKDKQLLLAVSGGLDSMVLTHLCLELDYSIAIAHCNFNLRGDESDEDAHFLKEFCKTHTIPIYSKSFLTKEYAATEKVSTQMAARTLRYNWFKELVIQHQFDHLLTAHHLNDSLETFLINFSRGTGLAGLTGIPEINNKIIRPLLPFSRKRIYEYAKQQKINWREDRSNLSDDYVRNHLRHHAIPAFEKAQPNLLQGFAKTQLHLKESESLLKVYDQQLRQQYTYTIDSERGASGLGIDLNKLKEHPEVRLVLYRLLSAYNFVAWDDVYALSTAQSGKQIFSKTHRLLKNRNALEIYVLEENTKNVYTIDLQEEVIKGLFGSICLDTPRSMNSLGRDILYVKSDLLQFPLTIRRWEEGDYFYPLGMKGRKKLSKYFKDEKLSLVEKENVWVLCSNGDIVWVMGYRADERFKVTTTSKEMTRFTLSYEATNN